ncbi:MAG: hypothetical protein ABI662_08275 [Dermatophilaceae bacterium]
MKRFVVVLSTWAMGVALLGAMSPVSASAQAPTLAPAAAVSAAGGFTSLAPSRLLDTREGIGAPKVAVAANGTVNLQVTGKGGVPSGVSAVVLNVTVTAPTALGFVTVYGADPRPTASNLNFVKGQTVPNLVIAPVRSDGTVNLYNGSAGTTQLIADVSGYFLSGAPTVDGAFGSLAPNRLLDTREGIGAPKVAVAAHGTVHLQVTGSGGVPSGVSAVVLNVTVTAPTALGFVTVFGADPRPTASNLNFVKGQTVPNLVIAPVRSDGTVNLYNGSAGTTQLIADVSGYFLSGAPTVDGAFGSLAPNRLLDTREGIGAPKVAVAAHGTVHLQVTGKGGVPASKVSAVVLNVTVTAPTALGFVTASAGGLGRPTASNLNFVKGQTVPNLVIAPVGENGQVDLYNGSAGTIQLIADVSGWFMGAPAALGSVSGTVTEDSGSHLALANVMVEVCPSFLGGACGNDLTAADGTYSVTGLATSGDYIACFYADDGAISSFATGGTSDALGYVDECYDNKPNSSTPTPVVVTVGSATTGIDAALADAGAISGRVTDAGATPAGLQDVFVMVYSASTATSAAAVTSLNGSYSVVGLPAGADYEVCFDAGGAIGGASDATGYVDQCYNNQPTTGAPNPVAVTVGATKSGINAALVGIP